MRRALAVLLLPGLALLAACGQVPQPFKPDKEPAVFAGRIDQSRIAVLPPQAEGGAAALPGNPRLAAEILAQALSDQGLLATPGHASGKMRRLKSVMRLVDDPAAPQTHETVEVEWTLFDPNGFQIDSATERFTLLTAAWDAGKAAVLEEVASVAAPRVAAFIEGPQIRQAAAESEQARIPGFPGARLVVLPVEGAPGDGPESLRQALERQLSLAGLPTADSPATGDLVVRGRVEMSPPQQGQQEIAITWTLEEAGRASSLGEVNQANQVPAGSLDGAWGSAAEGAAQGAADGLFDLLDRLAGA
jgi:hypothetical protein